METGNGNWKWKLETEMGTKKRTNHWCNVFFVVCLVIIVLSNVYMTGFASHVLCLYSCSVLCDYLFSVID